MMIMGQLVKGVYAVSIAAVLVAALWPKTSTQPQPVAVQPSPAPTVAAAPAAVEPSPAPEQFYDVQLGAMVHMVRAMDVPTVTRWTVFCAQTGDGAAYDQQTQTICNALRYRN